MQTRRNFLGKTVMTAAALGAFPLRAMAQSAKPPGPGKVMDVLSAAERDTSW